MEKKKKTGGRAKGTPNKASATLRESLQLLRFNLAREYIKLYNDPNLPLTAKVRMLETLFQYTHPRLKEKEVDLTTDEEPKPQVIDATATQLLAIVDGKKN